MADVTNKKKDNNEMRAAHIVAKFHHLKQAVGMQFAVTVLLLT